MADIPTKLIPTVAISDETGLPKQDLLQKINALIDKVAEHEERITDLEP